MERVRLDVLKDIRECLKEGKERDNSFQQQLIVLKMAKKPLKRGDLN